MKRLRIAALLASLEKEYQSNFARGMAAAAARLDVDLCIFNCKGFSDSNVISTEECERAIFDLPDLSSFDGVVSMNATVAGKDMLRYLDDLIGSLQGVPRVVVDAQCPGAVSLYYDGDQAERQQMMHLLDDHGYRRFAMITGPIGHPVADRRAANVIGMIEQFGASLPREYIIEGRWTRESGYQAAEQLLAMGGELPEVIVCGNDDMAFGVIDRMEEAGIDVPGQIAISGYDAKREAVARGLMTLRRPAEQAGETCIALLKDWAEGRPPESLVVSMTTQVVHGESCGCRRKDPNLSRTLLRQMCTERARMERSLVRTSSFSNALGGVSGETEIGRVMTQYAARWGVGEMHVCVVPDFLQQKEQQSAAYASEMLLLSSYSHGRIMEQKRFPTRNLIPILDEEREASVTLVFQPLYYLERSFGYAVYDLSFGSSLAMFSVMSTIAGALMSLSLQSTVRAYADALENMSIHDPLTGLYNRRGYQRMSGDMFEKARRCGSGFAVLSIDMDGMKQINDRFGHQAGDRAISRMGEALRTLEILGLTCVHISGDEFVVLGPIRMEGAQEMLRAYVSNGIDLVNRHSNELPIAASVGIHAAVPGPGDTLDDFLKMADRQMYEDKRQHHGMR